MATLKMYMLLPHHDIPADGPLVLGSIVSDLRDPGDSLNEGAVVEIAQSSIRTVHKYDWQCTIESTQGGRAGVLARFFGALPWASLGASFDAKTVVHYSFRDLETTYFSPSQAYVEAAVNKPQLKEYLDGAQYTPVYMITGLKIARGPDAQATNRRTYGREGYGKVGVTTSMAGYPIVVDAGEVALRQSGVDDTSFGGSSDFVVGYRLCKITFKENSEGGHAAKRENYTVGAMWGFDGEHNGADGSSNIMVKVEFDGDHAIAEELGTEKVITAIDEGDDLECRCFIVPPAETQTP
jgi:hypothetical protein